MRRRSVGNLKGNDSKTLQDITDFVHRPTLIRPEYTFPDAMERPARSFQLALAGEVLVKPLRSVPMLAIALDRKPLRVLPRFQVPVGWHGPQGGRQGE